MVGADRLTGHSNYFIGNDSSRWLRNIPQYGRVQYREVYPGIDLAFYGNQNQLEYDFEVSPGSDAHQIELNFKGATNVSVAKNGDLVLGLDGRELRFEAPHVYQKFPAGTQTVAGSFVMRGKNSAGFEVGAYDHSRALVIDPVLAFASYLGGAGDESCTAITGATAGFVPHCPAIAVDSGRRNLCGWSDDLDRLIQRGHSEHNSNTTWCAVENIFISRISLGSVWGRDHFHPGLCDLHRWSRSGIAVSDRSWGGQRIQRVRSRNHKRVKLSDDAFRFPEHGSCTRQQSCFRIQN